MAADFIPSKRGGKLLVDDQNYLYINVNVRSDRVNWKCLEFRCENCPARARTGVKNTDELHIYSASPHNHTSSIAKVDFLRAENAAMERAKANVSLPPRVILGDITNQLASQGHALPKTSNAFVQTLQR